MVFIYAMEALKGKDGSFTPSLLLALGLMGLSVAAIVGMREPMGLAREE